MLNPRQVEAFRAVMVTGSVKSAAKTMHVTQPAVSRLIRDLQLTLKLALFHRRGNRLEPIAEASVERQGLNTETLPAKALAAVPEGDPLAQRDTLGPKDFEGRSFISLGTASLFRSRIDAALAGVRRRQLIETQLTEIACVLVAEKAGLSLVDPFFASDFTGRGVVFRPFRPELFFDAVVLTPTGRPMSALAAELLGTFRQAARAIA